MFQFVSKRFETIESVDLEIFSLFQFVSVSLRYNLYVSMFQNTRYRGWNFHLFMPPTLKKWGTYWFRLVRMCVCIHVRDIVLKLHVWIPHGKIADAYFWFSLNYLPLLNYGPLTNKGMKFCKCRISKSIIARNLKLVMLIGDDD